MSENTQQPERQNTAHPHGQVQIPPQYYAQQNDEINLRELFDVFWKGKWWIIAITALFSIVSVFYALSLPNEYKATAIFAPASGQSGGGNLNNLAGQFGGLASLAGISLGSSETTDVIVAMELMQTWQFTDNFITKHNIELPLYGVKGWDSAKQEFIVNEELYSTEKNKWTIEGREKPTSWQLYESLKRRMSISQDKETGLIYVSFIHFSPVFSQKIPELLVGDVNELMKQKALHDSKTNISYLEKQISTTALTGMKEVFYALIEDQMKKRMLAEVSNEYAFKLISPAMVPEMKFSPKRSTICILGFLLGLMLSTILVFLRSIGFKS